MGLLNARTMTMVVVAGIWAQNSQSVAIATFDTSRLHSGAYRVISSPMPEEHCTFGVETQVTADVANENTLNRIVFISGAVRATWFNFSGIWQSLSPGVVRQIAAAEEGLTLGQKILSGQGRRILEAPAVVTYERQMKWIDADGKPENDSVYSLRLAFDGDTFSETIANDRRPQDNHVCHYQLTRGT